MDEIRAVYPNVLRLDFENSRTRAQDGWKQTEEIENKDPLSLFAEFFERQNGREMDARQRAWVRNILEGG